MNELIQIIRCVTKNPNGILPGQICPVSSKFCEPLPADALYMVWYIGNVLLQNDPVGHIDANMGEFLTIYSLFLMWVCLKMDRPLDIEVPNLKTHLYHHWIPLVFHHKILADYCNSSFFSPINLRFSTT